MSIERVWQMGLLPRVVIAIVLGILLGLVVNEPIVRVVLTFNDLFSQFLGFLVPLIIVGLITSAIGEIGNQAGKLLLLTMLPAYATALASSSSAATIPVTLGQARKNGVSEETADFVVPLCATVHIPGSMMKITACALAISILDGMPTDLGLFLQFILMLSVVMIAAPGVPGGAIMAALAPLADILGFDGEQQALMITIYIAMDSFGTACNVTSDGAIALIVDKIRRNFKQ